MRIDKQDIPKFIDHSLLRPDADTTDIINHCREAVTYGFFSVCVHPSLIKVASEILANTDIRISTVIGFPMGLSISRVKTYEAIEAVLSGADELDIVMNMGYAKSDNWGSVEREISDIITATQGVIHKIIIETCYLSDQEKKIASAAVLNSGAEFIKTSTGFGPSGAVIRDIKLIRSVTKGKIMIKAAGGISTLKQAREFVHAGASRIGTSSGVSIMKEAAEEN